MMVVVVGTAVVMIMAINRMIMFMIMAVHFNKAANRVQTGGAGHRPR